MGCHWTPSFYFSTTLRLTILLFPPLEPKVRHGAAFALYFMLFYAPWVTEKYKGTRNEKCIFNTTCIIQVSFNAFQLAIGSALLRFLKLYSTWPMCLLDDYLFRELSLSFWWGCHISVAFGEFLAPPLLKITYII